MVQNVQDLSHEAVQYPKQSDAQVNFTPKEMPRTDRLQNKVNMFTKSSLMSPKQGDDVEKREGAAHSIRNLNEIFSTFELTQLIVENASISDVLRLSETNKTNHATIHRILAGGKSLIEERFRENAWLINGASKIGELALIENCMLKAIESLNSTAIVPPKIKGGETGWSGNTHIIGGPTGGALLVQLGADASKSFVATLGGNIVHKKTDVLFVPEMLYANGTLCLGEENNHQGTRQIADWESLKVLPADPEDISCFPEKKLAKHWQVAAFDSDRLLYSYCEGGKIERIDVYDNLGSKCQTSWLHSGATHSAVLEIQGEKLITLNASDGLVKIWEFDQQELRNDFFFVQADAKKVAFHGVYVSAAHDIDAKRRWSCYAVADGTLHARFTDEFNTVPDLQKAIAFLDDTLVLSSKIEQADEGVTRYNFRIISPEGKYRGSFDHKCSHLETIDFPVIFMDRYLVTYGHNSDLCIWTKTGKLLHKQELTISNPLVFDSGLGKLIVMSYVENTVTNKFEWSWEDIEAVNKPDLLGASATNL